MPNTFQMTEHQMREAVEEWLQRRGMKVHRPDLALSIRMRVGFFSGFSADVDIVTPDVVQPLPPHQGPFREGPDDEEDP